ncbi:hypothetical protein DV735_g5816, partial [Chaetothyriales sp. CBS 134920]
MFLRSGKRKREASPTRGFRHTAPKTKRKRPRAARPRCQTEVQTLSPSQSPVEATKPESRKEHYNYTTAVGVIDDSQSIGFNFNESVRHWTETGHWPPSFAAMSSKDSPVLQKRSRTPSYSQSVKDGDAPRAYSPAFETILAANGVFMNELKGSSLVAKSSQALSFPLSEFLSVWQQVQNRNEGRVYRDLTPLLIPSPALLSISGSERLEHVAEEITAEWSRCKTLGGPKPKPDFAIGISPTAFDDEQMAKLQNYTTYERPTHFTDNLYFPFLLCEVKCGNEAINRADRQNMHSSSIAVKALVDLFQSLGNEASKFNGEILAFSISHDNERVKIYGHFPVFTNGTTTYYRFPVASFVLNFDGSQGWKKTSDFVREVYQTFLPKHLQRIRDALAKMDDPRKRTTMSVEEDRSQEGDQSAPPSHSSAVFKIPDVPASKRQKGES